MFPLGAVAGGQTSPHGVLSIACGVALRVVLGIILFGIALLPAVIATKCAPRKARRPPNVRLSGGNVCGRVGCSSAHLLIGAERAKSRAALVLMNNLLCNLFVNAGQAAMTEPRLSTAANGHWWITFKAYDTPQWFMSIEWLEIGRAHV